MLILAHKSSGIIRRKYIWFKQMKNLIYKDILDRGFPGGTVVENLPANAGDTGLSPALGRSHMPRSN